MMSEGRKSNRYVSGSAGLMNWVGEVEGSTNDCYFFSLFKILLVDFYYFVDCFYGGCGHVGSGGGGNGVILFLYVCVCFPFSIF